jgi:hypothetical protein
MLWFSNVVDTANGNIWPESGGGQNFDEDLLKKATATFRVAIQMNRYSSEAHSLLISSYEERMKAHIFAGNNAAVYASKARLVGDTIQREIEMWENALSHYQAAVDAFADAIFTLPDATSFESPIATGAVASAFEVFARGLAYESDACQSWLRLKYFNQYVDPMLGTYNPAPLLNELQTRIDHLQTHLLVASRFRHLPNYLLVDLPSVKASLALLQKQKNINIPQGMITFVGPRVDTTVGIVVGEYEPRFVPFYYIDDQRRSSYENIAGRAIQLIDQAGAAEVAAKDAQRDYDTSLTALQRELKDINTKYYEELGETCGRIYTDSAKTNLFPDITNCLLYNADRESERPFQPGETKGKIFAQYGKIDVALKELEAAHLRLSNSYARAVKEQEVGLQFAQIDEGLGQLVETNGTNLAGLELLRAEYEATAKRKVAHENTELVRRQAKRSLFGNILRSIGNRLKAGARAALGDPTGFVDVVQGDVDTIIQHANAMDQAATIEAVGEIEADLAEKNGVIAAQVRDIESKQSAAFQYASRDKQLLKNEEAWHNALLDFSQAKLDIEMAEQRVLMERTELANLYGRVSYLLQERQKAILFVSRDVNPIEKPEFRLWQDTTRRGAETQFVLAQEWTYLAAKAAQYKINQHPVIGVRNKGMVELVLRTRRAGQTQGVQNPCTYPGTLCGAKTELDDQIAKLAIQQGANTTALSVPIEIRHFVVQRNYIAYDQGTSIIDPTNSLLQAQSGGSDVAASDADWIAFLRSHLVTNSSGQVSLVIPFSTSLNPVQQDPTAPGYDPLKIKQNVLYSTIRYGDLIQYEPSGSAFGVRVNIRGRGITNIDPTRNIVAYLWQRGASSIRKKQDPNQVGQSETVLWNLNKYDGEGVNALVVCSFNGLPADLRTPQLHERSPANDRWELVIPSQGIEGAGGNNSELLRQLDKIVDIEVFFALRGFTN